MPVFVIFHLCTVLVLMNMGTNGSVTPESYMTGQTSWFSEISSLRKPVGVKVVNNEVIAANGI